MGKTTGGTALSDALVLFGVTGDLAHRMIFPALYAMAKRGVLNVPVVGVASSPWSLAQLRTRAADGIRKAGRILSALPAFSQLRRRPRCSCQACRP
jgi:glucose-6-phosphate 1-dehydrogenase